MRAALINMGSVLAANSTVEAEPASTATLNMHKKLRSARRFVRRARHPFLNKRPMGGFPQRLAAHADLSEFQHHIGW